MANPQELFSLSQITYLKLGKFISHLFHLIGCSKPDAIIYHSKLGAQFRSY